MLWRVPKVLTCSDVQNTYPQVTDWWDSPAGTRGCLSLKDGQDARPHRVVLRDVDRPTAATGGFRPRRASPPLPGQFHDIAHLWHIPTGARLIRSSERFLQGRFSLQRVKNHYTPRPLG